MLLNQDEPLDVKKKNVIKSILFFIFLVKIKKDKKKEYQGYEERNSGNDDTMYTGGSV